MDSRNTDNMGRQHPLTLKTLQVNKWSLRKSMHVTNQRTDSMVTSHTSTPLTPLTEGWRHTRLVEKRRTSFELPYSLLAMPQVPRSCLHSLSGNLQSPVASRRKQGSSSASIIETTKKPGWPLSFLKSEFGHSRQPSKNMTDMLTLLQVDQDVWRHDASTEKESLPPPWQLFGPLYLLWANERWVNLP